MTLMTTRFLLMLKVIVQEFMKNLLNPLKKKKLNLLMRIKKMMKLTIFLVKKYRIITNQTRNKIYKFYRIYLSNYLKMTIAKINSIRLNNQNNLKLQIKHKTVTIIFLRFMMDMPVDILSKLKLSEITHLKKFNVN